MWVDWEAPVYTRGSATSTSIVYVDMLIPVVESNYHKEGVTRLSSFDEKYLKRFNLTLKNMWHFSAEELKPTLDDKQSIST